jgi:hypothetical protein
VGVGLDDVIFGNDESGLQLDDVAAGAATVAIFGICVIAGIVVCLDVE